MTRYRACAISLIGIFSVAAWMSLAAGAQSSTEILTMKDVDGLLAKEPKTPADHAKLSKYFVALATEYEAGARKHELMGKTYAATVAGTKRPINPTLTAHCERLAKSLRDAAQASREIAADLTRMAEEK